MRDYIEELRSILASPISNEEKKDLILQYHENDIAQMYDELDDIQREELYQILGKESIAEVILYADDVGEIVENMAPEVAADIIETMDADDAIDILEELDEDSRNEIIEHLDEDALEDINLIVKYDDDVIGSKMTNNYITIENYDTIKSAMKKVISQAADNDNVSTIFVVDAKDKLHGVLDLRDLIIAREGTDINSLIKTNYPFFNANESVEECIVRLKDYSLDSYPIVDDEMHLIGVITSTDVVEAVDDEMGEDYAKLAGLSEEDDIDSSVFKSAKNRLPWLIILLILGLAQAFLMTNFEKVVASLSVIVFFQTLVLGMSGNTGTQSLAVTIRMLSDEEDKGKLFKAVFKELRVGFLNGLILAILAGGFVFGFLYFTNQGVQQELFELTEAIKGASIVGASLLTAMTLSSCVGAIIPIFFKKINVDPAVASGPFITTINDLTALLIYYGLAALLFQIVM